MVRPEIRTPRLVLRPMAPGHAAAVARLFADPAVSRHLSEDFSRPGAADRMVARRLADPGDEALGSWVFTHRDAVVGVGHVGPSRELPAPVVEAGWFVGLGHQGQGFATEAAGALVEYGLREVGLPAVWALVHRDNGASHAVAAHVGMVRVGEGHHHGGPHGVYVRLADRRPVR